MDDYNAYSLTEINDSIGTATLPTTTNKKVLVSNTESSVPDGNKETIIFKGTANLNISHPFGKVTFVKEKNTLTVDKNIIRKKQKW